MQAAPKYPVVIFWSDEDEGYIAVAPDLKGCSAFGETPEKALAELQIAQSLWLEVAQEDDFPWPKPTAGPAIVAAARGLGTPATP